MQTFEDRRRGGKVNNHLWEGGFCEVPKREAQSARENLERGGKGSVDGWNNRIQLGEKRKKRRQINQDKLHGLRFGAKNLRVSGGKKTTRHSLVVKKGKPHKATAGISTRENGNRARDSSGRGTHTVSPANGTENNKGKLKLL